MKAAVHLGPNYTEISDVNRNTNFEELKNLLDLTQRLILVHEAEIQNVSPIDWTAPSWTRSTLTHDHVIMWMQEHSDANQRWKDQLDEFRQSNSCRELFRIGGGPIVFEWHIFPGRTTLEILQKIPKKTCKIKTLNLENMKNRSSSCQCSMASIGRERKFRKVYFEFRTNHELREEILARTLDIPRPM